LAENQVDQAVDEFGNKIPGGKQYAQQGKDAADNALGNLEQEGEQRPGGMFGGNQGNS